ncbi:putative disease resistance protein RGA3 [Sesamum alatum]|uniref:Disease resistance protein RGA3 n=1 Tax=Sesamum alatum TaxID=300844 RepID=A0AAE1Y7S1_9LAMI|nr:putative disease resistance protein RGA3 [Sesamum alatum]
MADAGVSMVLNRLAPLVEKRVREEVSLLLNADQEVQTLSAKLKKIHEVLADAERKGVEDTKEDIKSWLEKLQEIAYDIDDALDEWELENFRQKFEVASHESSDTDSWEKKVCSFLQSVCLCFKQTVQRRAIALDVRDINERLDSIDSENKKEFNFIPNLGRESNQVSERVITTAYVVVSEIQGRDYDKETVISKLLSESSSQGDDDDGGHHVQIISVVGAGGMGKTSLAQLVFNNDRVTNQFELKIWVCVSNKFNQIEIAKGILEFIDRDSSSLSQPQALLRSIEKSISGRKFLLVLDDVWEDDDSKWEPFIACLKNGAPGSGILVTTRNENVAKAMGTTYMHPLKPLSDLYSKKCKGLPLAANTIGGLLRHKASLQEWQSVLRSEVWGLEDVRKDLSALLTWSYNELRPAVKRCFSYCAIFPKDKEIKVNELIRIWMAQGFLSSSGSTAMELEEIGYDYFEDLAMRSFFQDLLIDVRKDRIIKCKMHDMIHDFAQFLAKNECLIVERAHGGVQMISAQNARHLNILKDEDEDEETTTGKRPFSITEAEKLPSCFCSGNEIPLHLFSHLKRVRSLILSDCELEDIPKEIGNLSRIRYLDLSNNRMKDLPETLYDLYYLQTLNIKYCSSLGGLPSQGIQKQSNLRHLLNAWTSYDFTFPQGFEKLTNLRTLKQFGDAEGANKLECLKDLNQLGGTVCIQIWSRNVDELDAKKADLKSKEHIRKLKLDVPRASAEIIEALQPHRNLQILFLQGHHHLPSWLITLTNLRVLVVEGIIRTQGRVPVNPGNPHSLPPLGKLRFLEILSLKNLGITHVGHDFLGINETTSLMESSSSGAPIKVFPNLNKLIFTRCLWWQEWEDISEEQENNALISIFPCLEDLTIDTSLLKALPHRLLRRASSLQTLLIYNCEGLKDRYNQETGEDWIQLSHIPDVRFR